MYYFFIVNFFVVDLLFVVENIFMVFIYLIMNGVWKVEGSFGLFFCKFDLFLLLILILMLNLIIMVIGLEKFCGIFYLMRMFVLKRCVYMIIVFMWLISGIYVLLFFLLSFVYFLRFFDGNMRCNFCIECKKVIYWFIF